MGSPSYRLAAAITIPSSDEFLVVRQLPPPSPPAATHEAEEEYRRYVDSDLYDLPSAPLRLLQGELRSDVTIGGADSVAGRVDLSRLDVPAALDQILKPLGLTDAMFGEWRLLKYVEEAEFGPDAGLNTLLIIGSLDSKPEVLQDSCKWMSKEGASKLLSEAKPGSTRIGPYAYIGILKSELSSAPGLASQEYPPGIRLVPMKSRTLQPFRTTNLVVVRAANDACGSKRSDFCGNALLIDPGCCSQVHAELADLVNSLPKKLVVLVTHHHNDHIDGLSVVQRCNPDAVLLTHENTMKRIGKGNWSIGYTAVTGGENICIGDQELQVVFAPGHTDGHMGVLHVNTNALVVGDHCVGTQCSTEEKDLAYHYFDAMGHESQDAEYYYKPDSVACVSSFSVIASAAETQIIWPDLPLLPWPHGSATLDSRAGGNMKDYFETTYKFLGMSPHVLIPMHGRINLWPKHMLCGYLRHRRARESSILQSIEDGAKTLFDIVSKTYGDVDRKLWIPASFNVRLHVDHLNSQDKLPKDFYLEMFNRSCHEFVSSL